jgi:2-polyprenyl-3-methyl-5-hydroxy-6-metoxy-1,4-benzoquinol methylase
MIDVVLADRGSCRIVDLGGTPAYWAGFDCELRSRNVSITIVNLLMQAATSSRISCIIGDATDLSYFESNSFDIVHSNSVIEHVGDWRRMQALASEATRLAPAYFVQTPNFWFPLDLHSRTPFFHWLPVWLRIKLLMRRRCGFYPRARTVEEALSHIHDADCLTRSQMQKLFAGANIERERFLGMTKSWIAVQS